MIKLSKRLEEISSLVPLKARVVDIGCDHGLLDIYLYQNGIVCKIIASDINENALSNAKENIKNNNLEDIIETRLGSGLEVINLNDKIDTIIISGMGAYTIVEILKNNPEILSTISTIIIQSNTKNYYLRKEITKMNYLIEEEKIVKDNNKYYTIIKFTKGYQKYTKKELYFGPKLLSNSSKIFEEYKNAQYQKLKNIKKSIPKRKFMECYKIKKELDFYK
mgnify:FL=1